jgi:hypothetical protein
MLMRRFALAVFVFAIVALPAGAQDDNIDWPQFTVSDDVSALPKAVQETRRQLIEAARSGDIEALRPIIEAQERPPTVSYGAPDDAVDYLRTYSADGEGLENLAILLDLLETPYAVWNNGTDATYVWPYLSAVPDLSALTPPQTIDAYRIVSPEALAELIELDAWYYWRVHIAPDGTWLAFVAGD